MIDFQRILKTKVVPFFNFKSFYKSLLAQSTTQSTGSRNVYLFYFLICEKSQNVFVTQMHIHALPTSLLHEEEKTKNNIVGA